MIFINYHLIVNILLICSHIFTVHYYLIDHSWLILFMQTLASLLQIPLVNQSIFIFMAQNHKLVCLRGLLQLYRCVTSALSPSNMVRKTLQDPKEGKIRYLREKYRTQQY